MPWLKEQYEEDKDEDGYETVLMVMRMMIAINLQDREAKRKRKKNPKKMLTMMMNEDQINNQRGICAENEETKL